MLLIAPAAAARAFLCMEDPQGSSRPREYPVITHVQRHKWSQLLQSLFTEQEARVCESMAWDSLTDTILLISHIEYKTGSRM